MTPEEQALAAELLAVKYRTDEWNFGSHTTYQIVVADRTSEGVISLSVDLEGELIRQARIHGDLLLSDRSAVDNLEQSLSGSSLQKAQSTVQAALLTPGIRESMFRLLEKLAQGVTADSAKKTKGAWIMNKIKLEALIAWPPTSMCQEILKTMEDVARRHPDELLLLVFKRGVDILPDEASAGKKNLMMKGCQVPACVVNGVFFSAKVVPDLEELEARVQEVFLRSSMK